MKSFLKKYMIAGTLVFVPVVATIWLLRTVILWMDDLMLSFLPHQLQPKVLIGHDIPGIGLLATFILILLIGIFTRLYIGKKIVKGWDALFARLPFGRSIYQAIKQVLHTAFVDKGPKHKKVVLVEYPKEGSYAIGFVTGDWKKAEGEKHKEIMVFVPTAPNPTSGFLLIVSDDRVIATDMSTEEASKLLISGGLLAKKEESA